MEEKFIKGGRLDTGHTKLRVGVNVRLNCVFPVID